ncbi:MAG: 30S ribosomal protein S17 [Chloroflexi bacterium]|nr:30S ribosomal protein S17 [Chloroflexota bacterium]
MSGAGRKTRVGQVVSHKMNKTVVVAVKWQQRHPLYRKSIRRISRFAAHDEGSTCRVGDRVRIEETRPLSKTKRWRVIEVIAKGEMPEVAPTEIGLPLEVEIQSAAAAGTQRAQEETPRAEEAERPGVTLAAPAMAEAALEPEPAAESPLEPPASQQANGPEPKPGKGSA